MWKGFLMVSNCRFNLSRSDLEASGQKNFTISVRLASKFLRHLNLVTKSIAQKHCKHYSCACVLISCLLFLNTFILPGFLWCCSVDGIQEIDIQHRTKMRQSQSTWSTTLHGTSPADCLVMIKVQTSFLPEIEREMKIRLWQDARACRNPILEPGRPDMDVLWYI